MRVDPSPELKAFREQVAALDGRQGLSLPERELLGALEALATRQGPFEPEVAQARLRAVSAEWAELSPYRLNLSMVEAAAAIRAEAYAPAPAGDTVALKVNWEDGLSEPVEVRLPASAFHWKGGKPVGLEGPRVAVVVEPTRHPVKSVAPDSEGGFVESDESTLLGQTTSFFAAHQVLDLVERSIGYKIKWGGNGRLEIQPYREVWEAATELYFEYDRNAGRVISDAWASLSDAGLAPYTGRGFASEEKLLRDLEESLTGTLGEEERFQVQAKVNRLRDYLRIGMRPDIGEEEFETRALKRLRVDRPILSAEAYQEEESLIYGMLWMVGALNPVRNMRVDIGASREIMVHEASHAALDAIMPGLGLSITDSGLHEAYCDLISFLSAWDHPGAARRYLSETDGDLRRSCGASRIAEELAQEQGPATSESEDDGLLAVRDLALRKKLGDLPWYRMDGPEPTKAERKAYKDINYEGAGFIASVFHELFAQLGNEALAGLSKGTSDAEKHAALLGVRDQVARLLHEGIAFYSCGGGNLRQLMEAFLRADAVVFGNAYHDRLRSIYDELGLREVSVSAGGVDDLRLPIDVSGRPLQRVLQEPCFREVVASLAPESRVGDLVFEADTTTAGGVRVIRYVWIDSDEAKHGRDIYRPESDRRRGALVFGPEGELLAAHPVRYRLP